MQCFNGLDACLLKEGLLGSRKSTFHFPLSRSFTSCFILKDHAYWNLVHVEKTFYWIVCGFFHFSLTSLWHVWDEISNCYYPFSLFPSLSYCWDIPDLIYSILEIEKTHTARPGHITTQIIADWSSLEVIRRKSKLQDFAAESGTPKK